MPAARVSIVQALRADRAAFVRIAEKVRSLKVAADGSRPLDRAFENILDDTHVSFHLLPLALPEKPKFVPQPPLKRKTEEMIKQISPSKRAKEMAKGERAVQDCVCRRN